MSDNDSETVSSFLESDMGCPYGSKLRFKLIAQSGDGNLGTYGFIGGAKNFIVGAVKDGSMCVEDYGYALERVILHATGLGLGTCWLGGTFNRSGFANAVDLGKDELMPAVTPIGYVKDRRLVGRIIRWTAGSRNRKSWEELFFGADMASMGEEDSGRYALALEMVRIGPSASNGQPWRLIVDGDSVHFYAKTNSYSIFQRLDLGIAMCHFGLTMEEAGVFGKWELSDPGITDRFLYVASWSA